VGSDKAGFNGADAYQDEAVKDSAARGMALKSPEAGQLLPIMLFN
jgi:hypothetical protein